MKPDPSAAAVALDDAAAPALMLGGYRIVREVGHSAHGATMYLAEDPRSGTPVALKTVMLVDEPARQRFMREARACHALDHPGIVKWLAYGEARAHGGGVGWIAMEWLPGADLSRYTEPTRLLPEPVALLVAARIAQALAHAHERGVIHRDLKPANVRIDLVTDSLRITDFGSAWMDDANRTRSGVMIGTPAYMSPEQLAGAAVDARSDLYALGVLLYELLTGRLPFSGGSMGSLLRRIAHDPAPDLRVSRPDCPSLMADVMARLLAKHPSQRQTDGQRLSLELRTIARHWHTRRAAPSGVKVPRHND